MELFSNLKAVLWDMDGVLIDSRQSHYEAFKIVLKKYDLKMSKAFFLETFGMPNEKMINLIDDSIDPALIDEISVEKDKVFCDLIAEQVTFMDGVEHWLQQFKAAGVAQALASSGSWANINTILDALNARRYFGAVTSGDDIAGKPNPAVFLQAAEALDVPVANCLVIEDSEPGLQAAEAAGMKILAVATTNPPEKLGKADIVLADLTELKSSMLEELFQ
jgi:HAD superfamily hydrolase (TIGR01509 family)